MKKTPDGCGCSLIVYVTLLLVSLVGVEEYFGELTKLRESWDDLTPLDFGYIAGLLIWAIALAPVAIQIGHRLTQLFGRWAQREAEERARKERKRKEEEDREYAAELEYRNELWRRDPAESRRYHEQKKLEADTKVCSDCKMRIPVYSRICPYCRARFEP